MKQVINILLGGLIIASQLSGQTNNTEFRSTWVITWEHIHSSWSVAQNKAQVREILDNHQAANMNAVLWQVRQSGTAYYNSSYEPWGYYAGYSDPGYDPLAYAIEQAHARGMELHAWFNTFHASSTHDGAPAAEHPEWVCTDRDSIFMNESRALSPGLAAVRDYTLDVAMEIVNNYDIDGIHLDYIRWNEYTNSTRANLTQIEQESQLDGMISEEQIRALENDRSGRYLYDIGHQYDNGIPTGFTSWEEWWRWSVTTFVEDLHDSIQTVKPHVRLSVAALGKYRWSGWQGYDVVYQDAAKWFNEGSIEQLTPMHYHWLDATGFYDMLTGNCPECWSQYIQTGISDGRLFSAGPGSYRFSDANVWYRHPGVVNICRTIPWVDGFQFFSYGSWDYQDYWEQAGDTFFGNLTKVRETNHVASIQPSAPAISINKLDTLNYELTVTPSDTTTDFWFAIYRSEDGTIDTDSTTIIDILYGRESYTVTETFTGVQNYNGRYSYGATQINRYWNESPLSALENTDSIPSYPPQIVALNVGNGDTVNVNTTITIDFTKMMDITATENAISILPAENYNTIWSNDNSSLLIDFTANLPYATVFVLTIDSSASDINGALLDGNEDGIGGDGIEVTFTTDLEDIYGPEIVYTNLNLASPTSSFDIDEVITLSFDEQIDPASIDTSIALRINNIDFELVNMNNIVSEKSILSIKPESGMIPFQAYDLSISPLLTDTLGNPINTIMASIYTEAWLYDETTFIDYFSSVSNWASPGYSGSTVGILAGTDFTSNTTFYVPATSPRRSACLSYAWDTESSSHLIREYLMGGPPRDVTFDDSYTMQVYIFGDGSNNMFRFAVDDNNLAGGAADHEVSPWYTIDWEGWKLIAWDLSAGETGDWLGNGNLDGNMRIDSFQLTYDQTNGNSTGTIYFDELRIIKKTDDLGTDEGLPDQPGDFALHQNYPNPFNPITTIEFSVPSTGLVTINIYDLLGRTVNTLTNRIYEPGNYQVKWDGRNSNGEQVATGTYIYQMQANNQIRQSRKMIFVK